VKLRQLTPAVGAEIEDIDLSLPLTEHLSHALRDALLAHHVLVIRNQTLNRAQHRAIAECFGPLHIHPSRKHLPADQHPELFLIDIKPDATQSNGETWHADITCEATPPLASLLYLTEIPSNGGGDTLFTNMHLAFEDLSPDLKSLLLKQVAFHDGEQDLRQYGIRLKPDQTYPAHPHPLVIRHPTTGAPTLYVNESFTSHIIGMASWESSMLLTGLFNRIKANVRNQCRIQWQPGTLTIWDNYSVQHQAVFDYQGHRRYGERLTVSAPCAPEAWLAPSSA